MGSQVHTGLVYSGFININWHSTAGEAAPELRPVQGGESLGGVVSTRSAVCWDGGSGFQGQPGIQIIHPLAQPWKCSDGHRLRGGVGGICLESPAGIQSGMKYRKDPDRNEILQDPDGNEILQGSREE